MQNYQLFWNDQINRQVYQQLIIDWDIFITNFSETIFKHTHYQLNETQKQFIKAKIDPQNRNQIYKNGFLLFTSTYWSIPSNRTNLFKMKMNLTNILSRNPNLTTHPNQTIQIRITYNNDKFKHIIKQYKFNNYLLYNKNKETGQYKQQQELSIKHKGFLSIGSSQKNDIIIDDCLFVNPLHLKLISIDKEDKIQKKKSYFQQQEAEKIKIKKITRQWYIRDVAKSNRVRYQLDTPYKYVFAKPQLIITLGLADQYQCHINKIGINTQDFTISQKQQQQVSQLLNADRLNFMGEIDPNIPLKTVLSISNKEITNKQVELLYNDGLFYPPQNKLNQPQKSKTTTNKDFPSFTFTIINKRTSKSQIHTIYSNKFTIGRAKDCSIKLDNLSIKNIQLQLQCINNLWIINNPSNIVRNHNVKMNNASVYLCPLRLREENKCSNRIQLKSGNQYSIIGNNLQICLQLIQDKKKQDQY